MTEEQKLRKKRTVQRTAVTKYCKKIEAELAKSEANTDELEESLEQLIEKADELKCTDNELEPFFKVDEYEQEFESVEEYREKTLCWKFRARKRIGEQKQNSAINISDSSEHNFESEMRRDSKETTAVKLPKLSIPKFYGNCSQWLNFWSSFESAIHKNESLSKINKLNYLKAHLGGTAASTVEGFSFSADNYDSAIKLLQERFGRTDVLINAHMGNLLNIPPLKHSSDIKGFRNLFDKCQTQIRCLEALGIVSDTYGALLCPMLMKLLPHDLVLEFNKKECVDTNYKINDLMSFLMRELNSRERAKTALTQHRDADAANNMHENHKQNKTGRPNVATAADLFSKTENIEEESCVFCNNPHRSQSCDFAKNLSMDAKRAILRKKGICFLCLTRNHLARNCRAKITCSNCGKRHAYSMCFSKPEIKKKKEESPNQDDTEGENRVLANNSDPKEIYLQTLIVCIKANNVKRFVRMIIDTGSSRSYISQFITKKMELRCLGEQNVNHGLFGGIEKAETHKRYSIQLSNIENSFTCDLEVLDQETICAPIPKLRETECANELKRCGIYLSDFSMNEKSCLFEKDPNEIHVLLGANFAGKLFTGEIKHLSGGLVAMNTRLGWTIMGGAGEMEENVTSTLMTLHVNDQKISELWKLDTLGILDPGENVSRRELEDAAKEHFLHNVTRDEEGRYVVCLPWIRDHPPLSNCRGIAEKRIKSCIRSLEKAGKLDAYEEVFKNWLNEGIIEEVQPSSEDEMKEHFLPHHPVFKENSTTKVRPVFDGSARDKDLPSINDCLEKGPNVIELIPAIINRFRLGKFGVTADIKQAFLQIGLQEHDRPFLRFLWWEKGKKENAKIFQHKRVVFGISSSPFLLGATLELHLRNAPDHLQKTAQKLLKAFYVDNCVYSVDNEDELEEFISESRDILRTAKFDLRGWEHTPTPSSRKDTPEKEGKIPVLGLSWNLRADTLSVDVKEIPKNENGITTKRKILSVVHRIFDPIGFTCPVTLGPKLLLQECWKEGYSWDAALPPSMTKKFERWRTQLSCLSDLEIPRCLLKDSTSDAELSMHVFCDASKKAFATCIFLRCQKGQTASCQLIQAKSRIAPVKTISIPRMELLACAIGARLAHTTRIDLGLENVPVVYWSDSVNALCWIKGNDKWATFVYNRVQEIRRLTDPKKWKFISGSLNPADLPSRGCTPEELIKTRWWEGPNWLKRPCEEWPDAEVLPDLEVVNSEKRKSVVSATNTEVENFEYFSRISSYNKIVRIMAWILRFIDNIKARKNDRYFGELKVDETNKAERMILKQVQGQCFGVNKIATLQTFYDSDGLLRVKTRLTLRKDLEAFRHPILLPPKHHIVTKLIKEKHVELCHAGLQVLMSTLRESYWIIKSRKTIRQVLRGCVQCRRFTARPTRTPSAPLPEDRIREALIFEVIGVDLCGPLYLRNGKKGWVVLFTCAVFRAVHVELVTSLSTDSFVLALRRFIARRGRPTTIYSDNGTNLVGTANELKTIKWEKIQQFATAKKIQWKFNPPSAPWWGGFWERLVGMVKTILRKVLGRASLQYEELYTILCDAENIINMRPLTYLSEDEEDLVALTPAMFLQEIKEAGVPDMDLIDANRMNKRFAYRQRIRQDLRKRFRIEYLGQLREFTRVRKDSKIEVGDIVLVGDDNTKRLNWPLAKVRKLFPGKDGRVRVVEVKTKAGSLLRPVQRIYPLEVQENDRSPLKDQHSLPTSKIVLSEHVSRDDIPATVTHSRDNSENKESRQSRFGRLLKPTQRMDL